MNRDEISKLGGKVKSPAKKNAAKCNGAKGGRKQDKKPSKQAIYMRKYRARKTVRND